MNRTAINGPGAFLQEGREVVGLSALVGVAGAGLDAEAVLDDGDPVDGLAVVQDGKDAAPRGQQEHFGGARRGHRPQGCAPVAVVASLPDAALPVQRGLESRQRLVDLSFKVISQIIDLCVYSFLKCQCTLSCKGFRTS